MEIHVIRNGLQKGPYSEEALLAMLSRGDLSPSDQAWHAGLTGWRPLSAVLPGVDDSTQGIPEEPQKHLPEEVPRFNTAGTGEDAPALPKQKAFLSYMGISFGPRLGAAQASALIKVTMDDRRNRERLARWEEERFRLHPDIFAGELQARRESRPDRFHALVESEGAEWFHDVSKAHCQVLVRYLDVRYPNWDARGKEALRDYFYPALAEKFAQLVTKAGRGKFQFPGGPKVADELKHPVAELPFRANRRQRVARLIFGVLMASALGAAAFYVAQHPEALPWAPRPAPAPAAPAPEANSATAPAAPEPARPAETARPAPSSLKTTETAPIEPQKPAAAVPSPAPATPPAAALRSPGASNLSAPPAAPAMTYPFQSNAAPAATPRASDTVTVKQPVEVKLSYGKIIIRPGTLLKVTGRDANTVKVLYGKTTVSIPVSLVEWR